MVCRPNPKLMRMKKWAPEHVYARERQGVEDVILEKMMSATGYKGRNTLSSKFLTQRAASSGSSTLIKDFASQSKATDFSRPIRRVMTFGVGSSEAPSRDTQNQFKLPKVGDEKILNKDLKEIESSEDLTLESKNRRNVHSVIPDAAELLESSSVQQNQLLQVQNSG